MAVNIITDGLSGDIILPTTRDIVIKQNTVTLNDEQIKSLPSSHIIVVPTPGVGKAVYVTDIIYSRNIVSIYTNVAQPEDGYAGILLGFDGYDIDLGFRNVNLLGTDYRELSNVLSTTGSSMLRTQIDPSAIPISSIENIALSIDCSNTLGDFTGGDPLNTIKITVAYVIIDL